MIEALRFWETPVVPGPPPRLVAASPWASGSLSHEERRALDDAGSSPRDVKAGVDLVSEGDRADDLLILTEGWAFRYATTERGGRQISALLLPGDIGNLDSLMFDHLEYGVRTLTDAMVVELPRARALALGDRFPAIARMFTRLAMSENRVLTKWLLLLGRRSARERLAHLLCELSVRLGTEDEAGFVCPLTQEQFADLLGLTSVHVNRTLQQLRQDGLIATDGRKVSIPDLDRLGDLAAFDPSYLGNQPLTDGRVA